MKSESFPIHIQRMFDAMGCVYAQYIVMQLDNNPKATTKEMCDEIGEPAFAVAIQKLEACGFVSNIYDLSTHESHYELTSLCYAVIDAIFEVYNGGY